MAKNTRDGRVEEGRDDLPIFIHSELDDYPLQPVEFRVYGRIARRAGASGQCLESPTRMAAEWDISESTVRRALKLLFLCNLVSKELRPGKSTVYRLQPRRAWAPKSEVSKLREQVLYRVDESAGEEAAATTPPLLSPVTDPDPATPVTSDTPTPFTGDRPVEATPVMVDRTPPSLMTDQPLSPETDEGSPSEGSPLKVLPFHTHALDPAAAGGGGKSVCVSGGGGEERPETFDTPARLADRLPVAGTRYLRAQLKAYGSAHPRSIKDLPRWLNSPRTHRGDFDESIAEWYEQGCPVEGSEASLPAAAAVSPGRDSTACPDCHGKQWWYPDGPGKGVAKCRHPKLAETSASDNDCDREVALQGK